MTTLKEWSNGMTIFEMSVVFGVLEFNRFGGFIHFAEICTCIEILRKKYIIRHRILLVAKK